MKRFTRAVALSCALSGSVGVALAHETWLLPDDFSPEMGESISYSMTSGMGFPAAGSAINADRVVDAAHIAGNVRLPLALGTAPDGALTIRAEVGEGVNCAWVQLRPRILEIPERDDVAHYLEEIGAPEAVWEHWQPEIGQELWRESYSKLARSYLRPNGAVPAATCLSSAAGARFDIRPLRDPTSLKAGDTLSLQVFFDGEALAGQSVTAVREGAQPQILQRSNADGLLEVTLRGAGRYMIYATHLRPADGDDFNWESDFVTLTFKVANPESR